MNRLAILLRAINVGGNNKIAMADLREVLSDLGYADAETLLNSGNAIITTDHKPDKVTQRVQRAIASELGLAIETLVRTHDELSAIVDASPLKDIAADPTRYAVVFLKTSAPAGGLKAFEEIDETSYAPEQWQLLDRELYVWYANGQARTKLTGAFWEKKLKVVATARNWSTVLKLRTLTAPAEADE